MKFEEGKFYKTKNGLKAEIYKVFDAYLIGAVEATPGFWACCQWSSSGAKFLETDLPAVDSFNLVSIWEQPKPKRRVWFNKGEGRLHVAHEIITNYISDWEELEWLREP